MSDNPIETTMSEAISKAQEDELVAHDSTVLIGEDIGHLGGVFRATAGLIEQFGSERVIASPLGEAGIVGTGLGMALNGARVIAEIQFEGFIYTAFNQLATQVSRMNFRFNGNLPLHLVVRLPAGSSGGAVEHHQESPESTLCSLPGLRVVYASTPNDGYWLLREAIELGEPVVCLEAKRFYWKKGVIDPLRPDKPLGEPQIRIVNEGTDITIISWGSMLNTATVAAAELSAKHNIHAEVIDLRYLNPIDWQGLGKSLAKTHHGIICHETSNVASLASYLGIELATRFSASLGSLPKVIGTPNEPLPPAKDYNTFIAQPEQLVQAAIDTLTGSET